MAGRITSLGLLFCLVAVGFCLYFVDNANLPVPFKNLAQVQQALELQETYIYEIHLEQTAKHDEFVGTAKAKAKEGSPFKEGTLFNLAVKVKDRDVTCEGWSGGKKAAIGFSFTKPPEKQPHPRMWVYLYAILLCVGVYAVVYPLLGIFGWRAVGSPRAEKWHRIIGLCHCVMMMLWVYGLITVIQEWPVE